MHSSASRQHSRSREGVAWLHACVLALSLATVLCTPVVLAAPTPPGLQEPTFAEEPGNFDTVVTSTRLAAQKWMSIELPYARGLFWTGAVIELVISVGLPLVRGAEIGGLLAIGLSFALRKGFWAMMLETAMTTMPAIVRSFQELGMRASGVTGGITPQAVVDGLGMFTLKQWGQVALNPLTFMEVAVGFLLVVIPFGFCALFTWVAYLRMYFVMGGGVIMLGFAGTIWTEDYARRYLNYVLGSGINLLVIELAKGLFFDYLMDWIHFVDRGDQTLGLATAMRMGVYGTAMAVALISLPGHMAGIANGTVGHAVEALSIALAPKALMAAGAALAQSAQALVGAAQSIASGAGSSGVASSVSGPVSGSPPPSGGFGYLQGPGGPTGLLPAGGDGLPALPRGPGGGVGGPGLALAAPRAELAATALGGATGGARGGSAPAGSGGPAINPSPATSSDPRSGSGTDDLRPSKRKGPQ